MLHRTGDLALKAAKTMLVVNKYRSHRRPPQIRSFSSASGVATICATSVAALHDKVQDPYFKESKWFGPEQIPPINSSYASWRLCTSPGSRGARNTSNRQRCEGGCLIVTSRRFTFVATGEMVIRKATSTDIAACAVLICGHVSGNLEDWRSRFERDLANPQRQFLVATVDASVVGYGHTTLHSDKSEDETTSSPTGYFLSGLLVSPAHRRKGLGILL